jgi:drug/metabolite transporter (DMT)-like permease
MSSSSSVSLSSWLTLGILGLVWGSSFILIKKGLVALTPVQLACLRISISSLAFTPVLFYHRKRVEWTRWKYFLLVGLTGSGLPAFLYSIAQTEVNSSLAGMLNSMTPIFTLIIGILFFRTGFSWGKILGVVLGFTGVCFLIFSNGLKFGGSIPYALLIVIGTMCYGTSVNIVKEFFQNTRSLIISAVSFFLIGPPAIIYLLTSGAVQEMAQAPQIWMSLGAVTLLSLVGTVSATIIFYKLVKDTNAVFASSVAYIMPIVALGWGFWDGEELFLIQILGMFFILIGVYIIKQQVK